MPRFAANLSLMFTELPLIHRLAAARRAGFPAVEIQFPYEIEAEEMAAMRERVGVEMVLINLPAGDAAAGDRGLGAVPGREAEFRAGVEKGRAYAERCGVPRVNMLAGIPPVGTDPVRARDTMIANARFAAEELGKAGIRLCIEAINRRDVPGFFVSTSAEALAIIDAAGHPNIAFQYDVYHMQIMEGDLIPTMTRILDRIDHIQFADTPGRNEPGTGEINFPNLFAAIDAMGYGGWLAAEYKPSRRTEETLAWLPTPS